jgi:translation initiation factor IF-1
MRYKMAKEDMLEVDGIVVKMLRGSTFDVELQNKHVIRCTISGKLRMNKISIVEGDKVTVSMSPYDLDRGIITWRRK